MTAMIDLGIFRGQKIAVLGLARSGFAAAQALRDGGATVAAWDDDAHRRTEAAEAGLALVDPADLDWRDYRTLVLSPGIPHRFPKAHPTASAARAGGAEIIGDIELMIRAAASAEAPDWRWIGITGTNGKSTTTALIGHVLAACGLEVAIGGNLGVPVLTLPSLGNGGIYVLEMSSYQLELTPSARFDIAVLLNISPDHLDRHGGMDGYVAAKRRILDGAGTAVIGVDDTISGALAAAFDDRPLWAISGNHPVAHGVYAVGPALIDDHEGGARTVLDLTEAPGLPGAHNAQNAAATYAASRALGLDRASIAQAIKRFPGLSHRQERVAEIGAVRFINDSKATNADATARALACYDTIYWIAGGVPKAGGIAALAPYFPRIAKAFLIGEAAQQFSAQLGATPHTIVSTLDRAVVEAFAEARRDGMAGAVVLLSPACASFDQFTDFEARGDAFRHLVLGLRR